MINRGEPARPDSARAPDTPEPARVPAAADQAPDPVLVQGIAGIPEITRGADLAALIAEAAVAPGGPWLFDGDILVVTSKVVSKAEGRVVAMRSG